MRQPLRREHNTVILFEKAPQEVTWKRATPHTTELGHRRSIPGSRSSLVVFWLGLAVFLIQVIVSRDRRRRGGEGEPTCSRLTVRGGGHNMVDVYDVYYYIYMVGTERRRGDSQRPRHKINLVSHTYGDNHHHTRMNRSTAEDAMNAGPSPLLFFPHPLRAPLIVVLFLYTHVFLAVLFPSLFTVLFASPFGGQMQRQGRRLGRYRALGGIFSCRDPSGVSW